MNVPRRNRLDQMSPAEVAIMEAKHAVENMPPDVRLTEAVTLLTEAQNKVADFIDGDLKMAATKCVITPAPESRDAYAAIMWAWRGFVRELQELNAELNSNAEDHEPPAPDAIDTLIKKYRITEFEADGIQRVGILFPDDGILRDEFKREYLDKKGRTSEDCTGG